MKNNRKWYIRHWKSFLVFLAMICTLMYSTIILSGILVYIYSYQNYEDKMIEALIGSIVSGFLLALVTIYLVNNAYKGKIKQYIETNKKALVNSSTRYVGKLQIDDNYVGEMKNDKE